MNLLKQNRQKRATPTNADLSCDSVTPAHSRPIGVCLSWAFVCQLAGTAHCSSMLPQVISILDLFLVDVRAIKNNWETDSNWVLAVPRAGVCSQGLQDPWEGWTQGRATCLCQPPARALARISIRQTCNFPLISLSFSMLLTSCLYLLQIICFSWCFTINLYYFCWFFFSFSLSHLKKERDYLISSASEINPHYGFVSGEEEADFHSQPVLGRYLKVIVQSRDISLV